MKLPQGYNITWGGEFENQQRAMGRLIMIIPVSMLLIFVLLFEAFKTVKSAALILLNVPFALVGGILALYLTGIHLSVSAAIGFIALFGQAVLNGVVMVSYFNQLQERGVAPYGRYSKGRRRGLRTVLMTSMLAMLGLLPMALSHGIGSEVQRPLAVVIIGGLVSATILTLIVLPALYLMFHAGPDTETLYHETLSSHILDCVCGRLLAQARSVRSRIEDAIRRPIATIWTWLPRDTTSAWRRRGRSRRGCVPIR